jgi:acyl transferase domain-containing protein
VNTPSSDCGPIAVIGLAFGSGGEMEFDRNFFGLSAAVAASMPVRDRAVLELAWSAVADAGIVPDELAGRTAGVFLDANADGVAEFLRLTGPVVPVRLDTSSAVLAVQIACRSLLAGECDVALAGGARPDFGTAAGDAGAGVLALTPLSRAEAAQDLIRYVIHDGASVTGSGALDVEAGLAGLFAATARLADPADSDVRIMISDGQLVLSAPPPGNRVPAPPEGPGPRRVLPWVLSAKSTRSLRSQAAQLAAHVAGHEELRPADVAYSLVTTRPGFSHRAVVLAAGRDDFRQRLSALASGEPAPGVIEGQARPGRRVAFLFPGEGGQRPGMGRELYEAFGVFAGALEEACEAIAAHASWSVRELLLGEEERSAVPEDDHALYTQDGLFALQFALFRLLTVWEVPVDYVLGHSVGEFAAATAAGVFTLDDAAALLAERVRLVRRHMPAGGAMAAIAVSAGEAMESMAGNEERVSVAAINGPSSVVLSGDRAVVGEIVRQWAERGRKVKELPVSRAFHSHHFDALLPGFERFLERLPRSAPRIPLVSILYGRLATAEEVCAPGYLPRQVRGTSQFLAGMRWLEAAGVDTFVELTASGMLSALGRDCLSPQAAQTALLIPTLRGAGRPDEQSLLTAVAQLHTGGVHVAWRGPLGGSGRRVRLPGYAFEPVPGAEDDDSASGLAGSLAAATPAEQTRILLDLVRAGLAAVLERPGLADIEPETSLRDLGFTSLAVVELANRLTERTGVRVGAPLIFDHPSPVTLAAELARRLRPDPGTPRDAPAVVTAADTEPIAIVGMSCRFPGGVHSPEELWDVLVTERDVISGLPANRDWNLDDLYDQEPGRPGRSYVREGGFLADAGEFDAGFFGISPVEALGMDPQQRLLLESAWEALERAGIDPFSVRGSRTGVFAGLMHGEYGARSLSDYGAQPGGEPAGCVPGPASGSEAYLPLGTATSIATGRIAYTLGLEGPVVTLDTACSSSLVALHLAAQALRGHECDLALAGAATVMSGPLAFLEFSRQRALAPDARCKPFSASANGTAWSEGVGMLVVERLPDALRHNHRVLAVLRGSAVNSDGASNGLTAPNGLAQQRVIRAALCNAGLRPDEVDAVEAHGTGTTLGDPIEAEALLATYGRGRAADRPLLLGSVKSNLGHAQVAAGMAGVIKMVFAIRAGVIPATLHFDRPSPHVDWDSGAVEVVTRARPWPPTGAPRRAGVSAFGISGTNAHVIIEEAAADHGAADRAGPGGAPVVRSSAYVWPVSGRTTAALRAQAERLAAHAATYPELDPADMGWSLAVTRPVFPERAVVTGSGREDLLRGLTAIAAGAPAAEVVSGAAGKAGKTVFVFPGQGSQWAGMGRELAACSPVFAGRLAECAAALAPYVDWDLNKVLAGDLETADTVQPALWAVMVSLAAVWEAAGVIPDAVIGHSQGEIAAACVAGILSLEDAAKVVALRSRGLTALAGRGGMLSVASPADLVRRRLGSWGDQLSVAAVNGPAATVVSGEPGALDELAAVCEADGVRVKRVPVDYASHGVQVEELRDEMLQRLRGISPGPFRIPMISAMTGEMLRGPEAGATYWYESLRAPVEFERAVRALADSGHGVFIEVSPHPVLAPAITDSIDAVVTGTLRRDDGAPGRLLASLGEAWVRGTHVDWAKVLPAGRQVDLPTYAFQRQRYWPEPARPAALAGGRRYRVEWVRMPGPGPVRLAGTWLVAVPAGHAGLADGIVRALTARGAGTVVVQVAAGQTGRAALAACLGVVRGVPTSGVVSLLAFDETPLPAHPAVAGGLAGTLELVQALGDEGLTVPLWVATRGAVGAGPGEAPSSPVQAAAWGLGRVAGLEHPRRWGGLVDLPPTWDERVAGLLCGVLAGGTGEDEVAIRGPGVLARRLVRAPSRGRADEPRTLRGTVLVTGGTGAIGPHLAGWLARRGAEHLVLSSRTGPAAPGAAALAAGLSAAGVRASILECDIARRGPLAGLLRWIATAGPPLRAVVHAAATIDLAPLETEGPAGLAAGLTAKAAGAALLDELTAGEGLDAFVLFSSITGVWGSGYHGAYAAANAYLDALALGRRARGLPATSVAWGVWEAGSERGETRAVPHSVNAESLRRQGLGFLDTDRALESLGEVLADDEAFAVVADVDWARYAHVYRAARAWRLFDQIPEARALAQPAQQHGPQPDTGLAGRLAHLPAAGRERAVTDLVRAQAAAVLGHASASEVTPERAFREMGFDSLTAVQLRDRLNAAAGLRLPSTVVFDYPSPVALARYVLGELPGAVQARPTPSTPAVSGDPVVIVGMSCRFPGGVSSPEDLWELVAAGGDVISRFPQDRGWDLASLFDPDPDHAGTSYVAQGGFIDAAGFDAGFFGISPREARAMDPQQRLLLEVCWEAIERAGISPVSLRGAPVGVFAGASPSGYGAGPESSAGHVLTGNASSVLSGRVSYTLGLEGPAVTLDTACSSSLVALHLAAQALRGGDCDLALAGGVAVMASPAEFVGFSEQRALSPDGRCKAFGAGADGMGLAEGAGILVLERLSGARRNGHRVLAVVAGSAVNSDGASNGLTAPNGPSQQRVIRAALASAGLTAADVDAVEAHGTGTRLGDPIEAQALLATYGQDRRGGQPVWLGSVKSNIGHPQAAAGAAGIIKMVLALEHGTLPRTLHASEPSPEVDWTSGGVSLLTDPVPWRPAERPRRAGVSAFGMSGTNAHVILQEAPVGGQVQADAGAVAPVVSSGAHVWLVSGRSGAGLAAQARRLLDFAAARPHADLAGIGWSLATTRAMLEHRAAVTGASRAELLAGLAAVAAGEPAPGVVTGPVGEVGKTVFVFPGQGSQWTGMGGELAAASPVFAARLAECSAALSRYVDWSLHEVLAGDLVSADVVQPALWAVMVSLAAVWEAAGVVPDAVVGHSQGEIAAACVAGILRLEDAAKVVALRSRALRALAGRGGMLSVALPVRLVRERLGPWGARLSVAAVNGPAAVVVSGELAALDELAGACAADGVRIKRLAVDYASHSAQVAEIRAEILSALRGIKPRPPGIPMISAMTGEMLREAGPEYWYESLRAPVEFDRAVRALADGGHGLFIEVSPHPVLMPAVSELPVTVTGTLRRDDGGPARLLVSLAGVWTRGTAVNWSKVLPAGQRVDLPAYAFQHQRYWPASRPADARQPGMGPDGPRDCLFATEWVPVPVPAAGPDVPADIVVADAGSPSDGGAEAARLAAGTVLGRVQQWLSGDRASSRLVVVTRGAVAVSAGDGIADLAGAAVWGLVRSVQAENPGRVVLADLPPGGTADDPVLLAALCLEEPELAVRDGAVRVRRLARPSGGLVPPAGGPWQLAARDGTLDGLALVPYPEGAAPLEPGRVRVAVRAAALSVRDADVSLGVTEAGGPGIGSDVAGVVMATGPGVTGLAAGDRVLGLAGDGVGPVAVTDARLLVKMPEGWSFARAAAVPAAFTTAFDLTEAGPGRLGEILAQVVDLLVGGELELPSARCWDVRRAPAAFRFMGQARHAGPIVLTIPPDPSAYRAPGTVLVTGGTGLLGGLVAKHLAAAGRAAEVVLASRSGPAAPGVAGLAAAIAAYGTRVRVTACDAADRRALAGLLAGVRLTGVVHAAGVLDDGVAQSLTPARIDAVMRPKADAAWHLHELTRSADLEMFVLFSAAAATLGSAGQGNYSAANAFLDALAAARQAAGLPAVSLAWGLWADPSTMTGHLRDADRSRMARGGVSAMTATEGLALLDAALGRDEPVLVPVRLDIAVLRAQAAAGTALPALLRALASPPATPAAASAVADTPAADALRQRLAGMPDPERDGVLLDLVRMHVAAVLGYSSPQAVEVRRPFRDLGFDSLTAVELQNRLSAATGLRLPATVVFERPTPSALAGHLREEICPGTGGQAESADGTRASRDRQSIAASGEPIAIVGMGCRFPGEVYSPDDFWRLVSAGTDAVSSFPEDRGWDTGRLYDPDPDHQGTTIARAGGFLRGAASFDAGFFGMSPREAVATDPQQRLLLEVAWEALENAGIDPLSLSGSRTGVFVGTNGQDYANVMLNAAEQAEGYVVTGAGASVISGRVAYVLGLEGPAVSVDTACSSSLVALHQAMQALRSGDCSLALVGGVAVMASPWLFIEFSRQRALAADGRCKAFADAADGTGWGEGAGMLVIERLSAARRDGHRVLAIVRSSAINQDGASNGLTAPSGLSQQRVIRAALEAGGLSAGEVDVVEAHGTGTVLGDAVEARALLATYGQDRDPGRPLRVGSVKSNIGHTQAAAGVASLIKMVMAMRHGTMPSTLHVGSPSRHVDWSGSGIRLLTEALPWPATGAPRRAGISAFGISGTNVHVILEQGAATPEGAIPLRPPLLTGGNPPPVPPGPRVPRPWALSARSEGALREQASRLRSYLSEAPERLTDVGYSLVRCRAALERRAVIVATDREALTAGLTLLAEGGNGSGVVRGSAAGDRGKLALLFPGQGAQRAAMGSGLYRAYPVFARAFDDVCEAFGRAGAGGLADVISADPEALDATRYTQPALFAIEVALYRLLWSWGVRPDYLGGHSIGELAAAHVAGVLPLEEMCELVAARATLMQELPPGGAMVTIEAGADEVRRRLDGLGERAGIAALNGPSSTVISGDEDAVCDIAGQFAAEGRRTRRLRVSHAFHSPRMEPMLARFGEVAGRLSFSAPRVPVVSNVTGRLASDAELTSPDYWVRHVRSPVRFADGIHQLEQAGVTAFLEAGPGGALTAMGKDCVRQQDPAVLIPALRNGRDEDQAVVTALAELHARGIPVDLGSLFPGGRPVDLPTYPFQRKRYWLDPRPRQAGTVRLAAGMDAAMDAAMDTVDSWAYRTGWRLLGDVAALPRPDGAWLLAEPDDQPGQRLAASLGDALRAHGATVVRLPVAAGETSRDELAVRITELAGGCTGVLSVLAADERAHPRYAPLTRGLTATVALVQALADAGMDAPVWAVTRGAVSASAGDEPVRPAQTQIWGLAATLAMEYPDRWGGVIDVPRSLDERMAERVVRMLARDDGEDQLAVRPAGTYARRLARVPAGDPRIGSGPAGGWTNGTVLVTGGTGALGVAVARWLAGRGAGHVLLASRRGGGTPEAAGLAAGLAALGTRVSVVACDAGERADVAGLLRAIPPRLPLRAVFHAAGVLDDGVFSALTAERFLRVFRAKALGAQHLDELTRDCDLDAFVLFSSVTATLGNPGQANYAAANGFLDGLAGQRRAGGRAAISIAWGPWADGGMAATEVTGRRLRRWGVTALGPEPAILALERALGRDGPCTVIADIDWHRLLPAVAAARPHRLFDSLPAARDGQRGNRDDAGTSEEIPDAGRLRSRLSELPEADAERALLDLVRRQAAVVLGHESAREVEVRRSFMDIGFDSLTSVELRNRLGVATGLRLPATAVFDHPTPLALAAYLKSELTGGMAPPGAPALAWIDRLEAELPTVTRDPATREAAALRLRALAARLAADDAGSPDEPSGPSGHGEPDVSRAATLEDMLGIVEAELKRS